MGDIHGAFRAMKQCLEISLFDYQTDTLICLGDVCDGWPEVNKSIGELLKIKNLVYILGNHDEWALKWFTEGDAPEIWVSQGGNATMRSYRGRVPDSHIELLKSAKLYHIVENKLFVHGGFDTSRDIAIQDKKDLVWNRSLVYNAIEAEQDGISKITDYDEVYVGHTPTLNFGSAGPLKKCEVYMMDTGAGWNGGVLSMMDIESKVLFRSGRVDSLYPGVRGRG